MPPLYADPVDAPWELLARHLAAEASAQERAELRMWVQADPLHLQILTTVTRAWERAGEAAATPLLFSPTDVEAAWLRFKPVLGSPPAPTAPTPAAPSVPLAPVATPWLAGWGPVVVVLAVVTGGVSLWLGRPVAPPRETEATYATATHRQLVRLPDSSRVWLNAHSRLSYRETDALTGLGRRAVQLTGEAYFDVASTSKQPFVVSTATGSVRVAAPAAAFNIRAYAAEDSVEVSVARGQVWLLPSTLPDSLPLPAGTRAALLAADAPGRLGAIPHRTAASQNFRAWQSDTLRFEDIPVPQVARTLQATFGTTVSWSAGLGYCRFTGTFTHPRPAQVLAVLAAATASHLRPDGRGGYVLEGVGCGPASARALDSTARIPRP